MRKKKLIYIQNSLLLNPFIHNKSLFYMGCEYKYILHNCVQCNTEIDFVSSEICRGAFDSKIINGVKLEVLMVGIK